MGVVDGGYGQGIVEPWQQSQRYRSSNASKLGPGPASDASDLTGSDPGPTTFSAQAWTVLGRLRPSNSLRTLPKARY